MMLLVNIIFLCSLVCAHVMLFYIVFIRVVNGGSAGANFKENKEIQVQ